MNTNLYFRRELNSQNNIPKKQIISLLVKDDSGVLFRLTKIFSTYNITIESITVGKTQNDKELRINFLICSKPYKLNDFIRKISSLQNVIRVISLDEEESIGGELVLVKLKASAQDRPIIHKIALTYGAKVIDISQNSITLQFFGTIDEINELLSHLEPRGILEVARTGYIALEKGDSAII